MEEASFLKDEDFLGKQDPFVQFEYDGVINKTEVQKDAGTQAYFDETFLLDEVQEQVRLGKDLVIVTLDEDLTSSDVLGTAVPLSIVSLVQNREEKTWKVDLFHEYKKTGTITFTTQFIWRKPDPPPNPLLDSFSRLYVTIVSASFLKDSDLFGKQDPFVRFEYGGKTLETDVMDNAGLNAKFNQKFCLTNIQKEVLESKRAVF